MRLDHLLSKVTELSKKQARKGAADSETARTRKRPKNASRKAKRDWQTLTAVELKQPNFKSRHRAGISLSALSSFEGTQFSQSGTLKTTQKTK